MREVLKTFLKVFPAFFIIIFIATFGILNGYFEQDEWLGIASAMRNYTLPWWHVLIPSQIHFSPIGELFWGFLYHLFKLQAQYYFLSELIVHASVSALVYILAFNLTKNRAVSVVASFLFLLNGRAYPAFTNLAIFHVTDTALLFILLFFIYLTTLKEKIFTLKNIAVLFLFFLFAISTREEGFMIVPIFLSYLLFFDPGKINRKNIFPFSLLALGLILVLLFRVYVQTLYTIPIASKYQITGNGAAYNLATVPLKLSVQNLINWEAVGQILYENTNKIYPNVNSFFKSQDPILDSALFYVASIFISILFLWALFIKPKGMGKYLLFFSSWVFANALMLSFIGRYLPTLEPRYLYFSAFPVFCFFALFLHSLYTSENRYKIVGLLKKGSVIIVIFLLLFYSVKEIRWAVRREVYQATVKKLVLNNLKKVHPNLSNNTIFFIKCKEECFRNRDYGIPLENVLPFPSGPGMNFLVMYSVGHEKEWGPFFTKEFLFQLYSEDYKKIGDRSFGYFVTKSKLEDTLKRNHLSKDIVVALEVDEKDYSFRDISKEFRKTISQN